MAYAGALRTTAKFQWQAEVVSLDSLSSALFFLLHLVQSICGALLLLAQHFIISISEPVKHARAKSKDGVIRQCNVTMVYPDTILSMLCDYCTVMIHAN